MTGKRDNFKCKNRSAIDYFVQDKSNGRMDQRNKYLIILYRTNSNGRMDKRNKYF